MALCHPPPGSELRVGDGVRLLRIAQGGLQVKLAEPLADGGAAHAGVDELRGVGVAQLVHAGVDAGGRAVVIQLVSLAGADFYYGRRLYGDVRAVGLVEVDAAGRVQMIRAGTAWARVWRLTDRAGSRYEINQTWSGALLSLKLGVSHSRSSCASSSSVSQRWYWSGDQPRSRTSVRYVSGNVHAT